VIERVTAILSGSGAIQPPSGNLDGGRQASGNLADSEHQATGNDQLNVDTTVAAGEPPQVESSPKNQPSHG
jgi:hypothetical protein